MRNLTILMLILSAINSTAQIDSIQLWKKYEKEVIYFSGSKYIKNNTIHTTNNLKTEFEFSPLGKELFKMYQNERKFYYVFYGLGLLSYSGALIYLLDRKFNESSIFLTGSVICWGAAFTISVNADKKLKKAIWHRNRDMLYR